MNFAELMTAFQTETGIGDGEVDNAEVAQWLNEAQIDLAWELGNAATEEYLTGGVHDLPADCLKILDCTCDYEITPAGKINMAQAGTLTYTEMPTDFTGSDLTQTSDLHESLHMLLVYFAASRYWDQESEGDTEESNHATKWMYFYNQGKSNAITRLQGILGSNKITQWVIQ